MTGAQEEYEEELRWRLTVLKAMFEEGKIHIAPHLADGVKASLLAIKYGSDGKIDLSTVDGRVRSMALMAAHMRQRSEAKGLISLKEISDRYFEFIEGSLGFLKEEADERKLNAAQFAHAASRSPSFVADIAPIVPEILERLKVFWEQVAESAEYHIQDLSGSKAVFGGDLFPSYQQNIASTAGLYIDTIILSDPFYQTKTIFERASDEDKAYYLVKHALNVLNYKSLATADLAKPIVAFVPFRSSTDENERELLEKIMETDGLTHASRLFGRNFKDAEELLSFCGKLNTPSLVVGSLSDPSRLLFDTEWEGTLEEQINRALREQGRIFEQAKHPGLLVAGQCLGRMGQATDLLMKSRYLSGVPLIDAPTSWQYFNWKLEYNSAVEADKNVHLHMVKGLQRAAGVDEQWLGNIPPEALIEMRRVGAFEEIRAVLSSGVDELASLNPTNFFRSGDKIVDNIRDAFDRHKSEIAELRKKDIKFAGHDVGAMLAAGALDIASIISGAPTFGVASFAAHQLLDLPKLREIPARFRDLKNAHRELTKSPMGLLFQHKSKK